jgi:signal transduction histidine kinase
MTRTLGLRERLVGVVLAVFVLLLAGLAVVVLTRTGRALAEIDAARGESATRQLAESIVTGVLARSDALLSPTLDAFSTTPDLVRVSVSDEHGTRIAERTVTSPANAPTLTFTAPVVARASENAADELAAFGVASPTETRVGTVTTTFSRARTVAIGRTLTRDVALTFVGLGLLGLALVLAVAASVVRRVRVLADAAARVKGGNLDVTVSSAGSDELAALAVDFNQMTRSLRDQRRALDDAARELAEQEALAGIGRATAVIAHELKNPLGIILGAAEVAANAEKPEAAQRRALAIVGEEVRRLDHTLRQLLNHARPAVPTPKVQGARALIDEAVARASSEGGPLAGLDVAVLDDDSVGSVAIVCDEGHAHQILLNLFTNAAQAAAAHVRVKLSRVGTHVAVAVSDDGSGVSPSVAERLFAPFVTTKQRGAGLGLSASRRLARENGGDLVLAASSPTPGACFVLSLPIVDDDRAHDGTSGGSRGNGDEAHVETAEKKTEKKT